MIAEKCISALMAPRVIGAFVLAAFAGALLTGQGARAAEPTTCYVDKIRFANDNSGIVSVHLMYQGEGETRTSRIPEVRNLLSSASSTIGLAKFETKPTDKRHQPIERPLQPGDEVWLRFQIAAGDNESCRRDGFKLVYDPAANSTVKFKVKGGTLKGNRCRNDGNLADACNSTKPGS